MQLFSFLNPFRGLFSRILSALSIDDNPSSAQIWATYEEFSCNAQKTADYYGIPVEDVQEVVAGTCHP